MTEKQRRILDVVITSIVGVVLLWAFFAMFQGQLVFDLLINDAENFQQYLLDLGVWAKFAYVGTVLLEVLIAFIPGWIIYPVGAAVFGFADTIWLVMLGNFLGASISFWIGRRWGQPLIRKFVAAKYIKSFEEYMEKRGSWSIFFLKLNPLTSLDFWNYVAGASPMPFWKFTIANMLGIAPLVIVSTLLGDQAFAIAPQIFGVFVLMTFLYVAWFLLNLPRKIRGAK